MDGTMALHVDLFLATVTYIIWCKPVSPTVGSKLRWFHFVTFTVGVYSLMPLQSFFTSVEHIRVCVHTYKELLKHDNYFHCFDFSAVIFYANKVMFYKYM